MSRPEGPEGDESVWARVEREMREEGEQARRPLRLIWAGFLLLAIPSVADLIGRPLAPAAFWTVVGVALALGIAGLVWQFSGRRRP